MLFSQADTTSGGVETCPTPEGQYWISFLMSLDIDPAKIPQINDEKSADFLLTRVNIYFCI